jgi:large subunit ribosomal protein L21
MYIAKQRFMFLNIKVKKMYAVIKTGGKQYRVTSGDVIKIEKIAGDAGSEVIFNEVLAMDDVIGTPLVAGASVKGTIVKQAKDAKVIVFKKKRRQNYRRKNGHRQNITIVKITDLCK